VLPSLNAVPGLESIAMGVIWPPELMQLQLAVPLLLRATQIKADSLPLDSEGCRFLALLTQLHALQPAQRPVKRHSPAEGAVAADGGC